VVAEIRGWLQENVTGNRDVSEDEQLIEKGVLTSLQTVELVMFMEDRFDIVVEDEELNEETFASVRTIADMVTSKTG
jgi:methoxymalonate biosynthesis acyl carrier protein